MKARKIVRNRRKMDEKGVSPVIGVILMVAATIVVAAVVMGMLGGFSPPKKTYAVGASASRINSSAISITYLGGPDQASVDTKAYSYVIISNASGTYVGGRFLPTVGNSTVITGLQSAYAGREHVVVNVTFIDGTTQVILDTYV